MTTENIFTVINAARASVVNADDPDIGFADFMTTRKGHDKADYLVVRDMIKSVIAYYANEQRETKANERALKAEGPLTGHVRSESHANRIAMRPQISDVIALRRAAKAWSVHAKAGDPMLITRREAVLDAARDGLRGLEKECTDVAEAHRVTAARQKTESEKTAKAFDVAYALKRVSDASAREEHNLSYKLNRLTKDAQASGQRIANLTRSLDKAQAAVSVQDFAHELN